MIIPPKYNCNILYNIIETYDNCVVILDDDDAVYVINNNTWKRTMLSGEPEWFEFYKELIEGK